VWSGTLGAITFVLLALDIAISISNSRSSTALIGYIFLPFIAGFFSIPGFVAGWCLGYFLEWRAGTDARSRWKALAAILIPVLMVVWIARAMWSGSELERQVQRIAAMDSRELRVVVNDPAWAGNRFVLGAIAGNDRADAATLHRIVGADRPKLHQPMGSWFHVLGKNTRGLAVMRLVAMNPNTDAQDLEKLAMSPVDAVLGDVASNPNVPAATLQRLADHGGQSVERGLARNPAASAAILSQLALSPNEFTRDRVAANPNTPAELLRGLSIDPASHVRVQVAMNPSTPRSVVERLAGDTERQVRDVAKRGLRELQE
jgi:hypothetical protein